MGSRYLALDKPFDLRLAEEAARNVTIKGLFLREYISELRTLGKPWPNRVVPFKSYPGVDLLTMVKTIAEIKHAHRPVRQAMHDIASCQFSLLRDSMIGRVLFAALGNEVQSVLRFAARGYEISSSEIGPVYVREMVDGRMVIELTRQAMPIEGWHSGVFAGAVLAMGRTPTEIVVDLGDEFNGHLELHWA